MISSRLLRLAAPGATAAALSAAVSARVPTAQDDDVYTAHLLRNLAFRSRGVLSDPPQMLARCARSGWQQFAGLDAMNQLTRCQASLHMALASAANDWKAKQRVDRAALQQLDRATQEAEDAVRAAREAAVRGAASKPWADTIRGVHFEQADGAPSNTAPTIAGKTVALYFTASWCGPCHHFTPKLVHLYEQASANGFEVVLVPWDEAEDERNAYARHFGMKWLALPHTPDGRALADELTLRYDVTSIPTLVVLNVSADGNQATILSRDARMDVERGRVSWLPRGSRAEAGAAKTWSLFGGR